MENRYDRYKDSGIAWIGKIPEHWEITLFKRKITINNGKDYKNFSDAEIYPVIGSGGCFAYCSNYMYDGEALLLGRKGTIDKPLYVKGKFWAVDTMFYAIPHKDLHCKFSYYLALTFPFNLYSTSTSLPSLTQTDLGNIPVAFPSISEQQAIADYLDRRCSEIDELIALQEEMITKLQSYKQSVITEAVTRGLDKNVPLKDSGIDWIGKIPEHWKVKRLKGIYSFGKGLNITKADLIDNGIPVISYGQLHSKLNTGTCIKDCLIRYVPEIFFENNSASLVKKGDVIFADTSEDLEGCGNCIYIDRDMLLYAGYHTIIAKNISSYHNKYFSYLFQTDCWRFQIRRMVNGVKLFSIPQRLLASTNIITPSIQEQQAIADYLDQQCSEIDELIALKQQKIEKLKEYKKSLIFECVTGKRKVS